MCLVTNSEVFATRRISVCVYKRDNARRLVVTKDNDAILCIGYSAHIRGRILHR